MPKTTSAKKALRQSIRRRSVNITRKKDLNGAIKTFKKLLADKKVEEAKKQLAVVYQRLDKAAKNKVIEKNTASRLKSRLTKSLSH